MKLEKENIENNGIDTKIIIDKVRILVNFYQPINIGHQWVYERYQWSQT